MRLDALREHDMLDVLEWRNAERNFLRTPHFITDDMQSEFYENVINARDSRHRYFAIVVDIEDEYECHDYRRELVGMGGLTNIEWENGIAEISLILGPDMRGKGYGMEAVDLLLNEGIGNMGLTSIYGEVYNCGNRGFWEKVVEKYHGYKTELTDRKLWQGTLYGSMWFSVTL
jgi:RimJ/RimL family protein N-acetyltransferase